MSEFATKYRTHTCGEPRLEHVPPPPVPGKKDDKEPPPVTLAGHVDRVLDEKTILLRDRYGRTQAAVAPEALPYVAEAFGKLNPEDVIQVSGLVAKRADDKKDANLPTGEVELLVKKIEVLSTAEPLPEGILGEDEVPLERRLAFRQLYLRRDDMKERLEVRARVAHACREFLVRNGFLEIETPHLFWYDPVAMGGEIIPDVKNKAWRLPSGPVVLNQYIHGGAFDRFFQFLRITRRESQPGPYHAQEHTGLDINMAYVDVPDFFAMVEAMLAYVWKTVLGAELKTPFKSYSFEEAMLKFGTDRVDARFGLEISDLGGARTFRAPGAAKAIEDKELAELLGPDVSGAAKLSWRRDGDDLVIAATAPKADEAAAAAGRARVRVARRLGLIEEGRHEPVWVHSYPLLEDDDGNLVARVVVFTAPVNDDFEAVQHPEQRGRVRGKAFDLMLDGVEIASAYIGNHSPLFQRMVWKNIFKMETNDLFRLRAPVESHRFGVPPHGGMNIGFDRLVALMLGAGSLDEVIRFPKSQECRDPLLGAPGPVPEEATEGLVPTEPRPTTIEQELGEEVAKL